jgi:hypothetical protein
MGCHLNETPISSIYAKIRGFNVLEAQNNGLKKVEMMKQLTLL